MSTQRPIPQAHEGLPKILGAVVKERMTGFQGVACAYHIYMTGCNRVSIQPPVDKDGKVPDANCFDESTIDIIEEAPAYQAKPKQEESQPEEKRGGPMTRGIPGR